MAAPRLTAVTSRSASKVAAPITLRSYATNPSGKSVPASSPQTAGVASSPTPEEALKQQSQTSADELEPIPSHLKARLAKTNSTEKDVVASSRPRVEDVAVKRELPDTATAAPGLAKRAGKA
ncbi:hypothetical protein OC846_000864 [Tilletia horrida]|uniref:Uncharacterized protein n=1 Tax=Tilletia horrida TaxID=155126 RepID=A0AAN6GUU8_9BASI|nr:hypothetical protein OC845_001181 [Tilletia horrida]KAK0556837.1 hypothetical protein OC846_000864 [Tilletia horrida]